MLKSMDASFTIELKALESLQDAEGNRLVEEAVQRCLPTAEFPQTLDGLHKNLLQVQKGPLLKWVSAAGKALCDTALEATGGMITGNPPAINRFPSTPFFTRLRAGLLDTASASPASGGAQPGVALFGSSALSRKMELAREKGQRGDLAYQDLNDLHVYEPWLGNEEREIVAGLGALLAKAVTHDSAAEGAAASSSGRAKKRTSAAAAGRPKKRTSAEEIDGTSLVALTLFD